MKQINLTNISNKPVVAHLFEPQISNEKFVLINSATGVKQQVYFKIAQFLAENGFTVLTYDYVGIGQSKRKDLKNCTASMRTWGTEDYQCVTNYIKTHFENFEKYLIGHSVGALILGMNEDSKMFDRLVFIGTQKAYAGHLHWNIKITAYLGFGIVQPLLTKIFGYFPAHLLGLGESLPSEVANDWRTLILNKKSTNAVLEKCSHNYSENLTQNTLVLRAEDDHWLTDAGVKNLMKETYPNLKPVYKILKVSDSPQKEIGHVNFFRSYNKPLWKMIVDEFQ